MPHPVLFPKISFFYPLGNTSAVCLTRDLPPDIPAHILLLGCGDVRNILYTTFSDAPDRVYDITCCDIEPAVLARNIILLSFLADETPNKDTQILWNIYYHFFLDKTSMGVLRDRCSELFKASTSAETWSGSRFGRLFKFSTPHTLQELRGYWESYFRFEDLSQKRKKQIQNDFSEGMKNVRARTSEQAGSLTLSSVGVLWDIATPILQAQFRRFWSTGTTYDTGSRGNPTTPYLNPTFVYSRKGEVFNVHYLSDPLCSFHLETAFLSSKRSRIPSVQAVIECARNEFGDWCTAFQNLIATRSQDVVIRFFCGDALAFCQALNLDYSPESSPAFASSWTWSPIFLEDGPRVFDVIESSNLIDHLGLMNVLALATPLLRPCSSSVLRTDSLRMGLLRSFESHFGDDISSLALLLGITPVPYSSGFRAEIPAQGLYERHRVQPHTTIQWRLSSCASPERTDPGKLSFTATPAEIARTLFRIYLKLFTAHESSNMMARTMEFPNYTRATFVQLLELVKKRAHADWEDICTRIIDSIETDRTLLVGLHYYQELCLHLLLKRIYLMPSWASNPPKDVFPFKGWPQVPPVVVVILQIPRHEITVLEDMPEQDLGTPPLYCCIEGDGSIGNFWQNSFMSIQFAFGSVVRKSLATGGLVELHEDQRGWKGKSDLVMVVKAPTWMLSLTPDRTFVGLNVLSVPATVGLTHKLGMTMSVYKARLSDSKRVFICPKYPSMDGSFPGTRSSVTAPNTTPGATVSLFEPSGKSSFLTLRANCGDDETRSRLSQGVEVTMAQITPVEMRVDIGDTRKYLQFPAFVDGGRARLRIARKSAYVEIVVPLDDTQYNRFPLATNSSSMPAASWNMHYLRLASLPSLAAADIPFVEKHLTTMLSDVESKEFKQYSTDGDLTNAKPFTSFRVTLRSICVQAARQDFDAFELQELGGSRTHLFLVGDARRDMQCHSIAISGGAMFLTADRKEELLSSLAKLHRETRVNVVEVHGKEMDLWDRAIPAFAERCRSWQHGDDCDHLTAVRTGQDIWCRCGFGEVEEIVMAKRYDLHRQMKLVALSPIYPLPSSTLDKGFSSMSIAQELEADECAACKTRGKKLLLCSRCKVTRYCSADCQKAHWKVHKKSCN
ncbi:hypothetical protein PQX77_007678 [Marasmius sp. AFHP31]|nr:hypothetical protein PQX77_007678 [Marasmius sp. AFHP31]